MADHEELLSEMELIERLPTQERLKQAKRRRAIQLKKWQDYEIELNMNSNKNDNSSNSNGNGVRFQDHIMLLDSVMRKDYQEGFFCCIFHHISFYFYKNLVLFSSASSWFKRESKSREWRRFNFNSSSKCIHFDYFLFF